MLKDLYERGIPLEGSEDKGDPNFGGNHIPFKRDMSAGAYSSGGALVTSPEVDSTLVDYLRAKSICARLGAEIRTGLKPSLALPILTGDFNAQFLGEYQTAVEGDLAVGQALLSPHRIVISLTASKLLPTQSGVDFYDALTSAARAKLLQTWDASLLNGAGGSSLVGILNTNGVGQVTFGGAASWSKILSFESNIGNSNADGSSLAWAQSPNTRSRWKAAQRASGTSTFLQDDQNRISGYASAMTTSLNSTAANDRCIFGDWSQLVMGLFGDGFYCQKNEFTKLSTSEDLYTFWMYVDGGPKHPASFCISTDSAAQ